MSERLLKEFQDHAVALVPVPDFDQLRRRGTRRRRARLAVGATVVASVLALGGTMLTTMTSQAPSVGPSTTDRVPAPAPTVKPTPPRYLPSGSAHIFGPYEVEAAPGRSQTRTVQARFVLPGELWYWRTLGQGSDPTLDHMVGGLGLAQDASNPSHGPYIRVGVTPITGVPRQRCPGAAPASIQPLPSSVLSAAQALASSPGVEMVGPPRSVHRFGYDAAHVQFGAIQRCPGGLPAVLWRALEAGGDIQALPTHHGSPPRLHHLLFDVWVVDVLGQHIAVFTSHPVDTDRGDLAQIQQLLNSIRFELRG